MSEETEGGFEIDDRDAGEVFMLSFGAIGALALLDTEPAAAALPAGSAPLTPEQAQILLRGAAAPVASDDLAPPAPAAADAAFLSALAAFGGSSDAGAAAFFPPASTDLSVPALAPANGSGRADEYGDEAIGSSSPLLTFSSAGVVRGDNLIIAMAADATLTLSGENDLVLVSSSDVVNVLSDSSVVVVGGGAVVNLASYDQLSLTGKGYEVHAAGADDVVMLQAASQATIYGDGTQTSLAAPSSSATVIGASNTIEAAAGTVTVGGGASDPTSANSVYMQSGTSNLMDQSALLAYGSGAAYLGANDYVALFGNFGVYATQSTGASIIVGFGVNDTLFVQSSYSDIAALLGGVTESNNAATLHLTANDSLTLTGLDKSQLSAFADSGHIRLD